MVGRGAEYQPMSWYPPAARRQNHVTQLSQQQQRQQLEALGEHKPPQKLSISTSRSSADRDPDSTIAAAVYRSFFEPRPTTRSNPVYNFFYARQQELL